MFPETLMFTPPGVCNIVKYLSEVRPEVCPSRPRGIISCQHFLILLMDFIGCSHRLFSSIQYHSGVHHNLVVRRLRWHAFILVTLLAWPLHPWQIHQATRTLAPRGADLCCSSAPLHISGSQERWFHYTSAISASIEVPLSLGEHKHFSWGCFYSLWGICIQVSCPDKATGLGSSGHRGAFVL